MRQGWLRSHDAMRLAPWLAALAILCALPRVAGAEGPWSARVVDAHTGSALEGVVVVSIWSGPTGGQFSSPLGMPGLIAVEEVVTDRQGRFTLPAVTLPDGLRPEWVRGPNLSIFKGGYGGWRPGGDPAEFARQRGLVEMRPLTTIDERLKFVTDRMAAGDARWGQLVGGRGPGLMNGIPYGRIRRYEAAVNHERVLLGLPRVGLGSPLLGEE